MPGCIYTITHRDSGKVYVGQTWRPDRRWAEHRGDKDTRSLLNRAIHKHGPNAFDYRVIATEYVDQPSLNRAEARYIRRYRADERAHGYNLRAGGRGGRMSRETRRRMSEAHRGKSSGAKGKRWSPETRAKISASLRGKKISLEHRAKIGAANHNRKCSPETRAKLSVASRGRKHSPEARAKMVVAQVKRRQVDAGRYA